MGIANITDNILTDSGTAISGLVATSRTISTSSPLTGGGDLSANRTIAIPAATSAVNGYLASSDWTIFNGKQPAGNYITSLTGEATGSGAGAASITLTNSAVIGKVLTGLTITGSAVTSADSILTAFGKVQNQINGLVGGSIYKGTWNASTNTPTLTSGVGTAGFYYVVNVAGSTTLDGISTWAVGDTAIFSGTAWQKIANVNAVNSVNGLTGTVVLNTDNIAVGSTNLYFTNALSRSAISLTVTGSSGASTYNSTTGVLNVPTYTLTGLGGQPLNTNLTSLAGLTYASTAFVKMTAAGTFTLDTAVYYLNSNPSGFTSNVGTVTSVAALTIGTTGTDISSSVATGTTTPVITLNIPTASAANRGALSAANWTTFNSKQDALSGTGFVKSTAGTISYDTNSYLTISSAASQYQPIGSYSTGFGTASRVPKWTTSSAFGLSQIWDDGTNVGIGATPGAFKLDVTGTARISSTITASSFIKSGGTAVQFLKADGSVDSNTYLTTSSASSTYLPLTGGTLTGLLNGRTFVFTSSNNGSPAGVVENLGSTNAHGLYVNIGSSSTGFPFRVDKNATPLFEIANSGAATFASSVTATSFFESSDKTIKTLIEDNYQAKGIESVIAKLYVKNGKQELGYFAQDVQGILPSAVSVGADGLLSLSYREVHTAKIARLEQRIEELEKQLNLN
jgi:hypothetical protein